MYKSVNPAYTTLYLVPNSNLALYNQIIYVTSLSTYILTWIGTALLLGYYYKKTHNLDFKFWIILAVPLALYLIGSGLIFSLPADFPYRYYFTGISPSTQEDELKKYLDEIIHEIKTKSRSP